MVDAWRLKPPAFHTAPAYDHTFGPQVARLCDQVGFTADPEQKVILDDLFAVGDDGMSAAYETAVIATRQQLKTGVMKQAALGWMFVTEEEVVTWSAHLFSTTEEAFGDLSALLLNSPILRKRLAPGPTNGIHGARGSESIELRDGRRLLFRSRTKTGGRGLTGDKIILDEAFALQDEHLGALTPTLTAVEDPQILYGSSAGMAYSVTLREIRDRGRAGSPALAYTEYAARFRKCASDRCEHWKPSHPLHDPGCALDDEELWAEANPLLGRRRKNGTGLTLAKMRRFRESEPPKEWMRERLGWWDESGAAEVFGPGRWESCIAPRPAEVRVGALGIAADLEVSKVGIVAAGLVGERVPVQPLRHGTGSDWLVKALKELQAQHGAVVVIDGTGPAAQLVPAIKAAGIRHHVTAAAEVLDACGQFFTLVTEGQLMHGSVTALEEAVNAATQQNVGDRWRWARRKSASEITLLEAATLAAWWVSRPAPRVPAAAPLPQATDAPSEVHELATAGF